MPKILLVPVQEAPKVVEIADGLKPMQDLVGGYIQNVTLEEGLGLVCNEEGKLQGLTPNRDLQEIGDVICGNFFLSRYDDEGNAADVTPADIKKYSKRFALGR